MIPTKIIVLIVLVIVFIAATFVVAIINYKVMLIRGKLDANEEKLDFICGHIKLNSPELMDTVRKLANMQGRYEEKSREDVFEERRSFLP